jgi:hypothetical protein
MLAMILFRWNKLQKSFLSIYLRWGTPMWGYPATRFGATVGTLLALWMGAFCLVSPLNLLPRQVFPATLFLLLSAVVIAAIYDFIAYKRNK